MPIGHIQVIKSRSNGALLDAAAAFVITQSEAIVLAPSHSAGEELAHRMPGVAGLHRLTPMQLASDLARPKMAALRLAPLTALGLEAVVARVVHEARRLREMKYFDSVAAMPGFPRSLARTIRELRLSCTDRGKLAA